MNNNSQNTKSIVIKIKNITKRIIASEISHIVCDAYLCDIFTQTEKFTCTKLLKYFETELSDYGFIRISRDILVNTEHIRHIENKTKQITLKNKVELQVSVRRWKFLKSVFMNS
ncbi:MAG: LytTR family transcriptional regulator DNA-binding domain-containing protein [Prevotellaceae bacterium]|jgi:DNA-binding LytR/AlgR family response regulator|nr:LytTR family transcriptional regulator DNA-binding domain-containing protein [Prevotellaceae bacterium]